MDLDRNPFSMLELAKARQGDGEGMSHIGNEVVSRAGVPLAASADDQGYCARCWCRVVQLVLALEVLPLVGGGLLLPDRVVSGSNRIKQQTSSRILSRFPVDSQLVASNHTEVPELIPTTRISQVWAQRGVPEFLLPVNHGRASCDGVTTFRANSVRHQQAQHCTGRARHGCHPDAHRNPYLSSHGTSGILAAIWNF